MTNLQEKYSNSPIKVNKALCKLCDDLIVSLHRHHFVHCKCGEIFVDGGTAYLRRGAKDFNNFIEMSEYYKEKENSKNNNE